MKRLLMAAVCAAAILTQCASAVNSEPVGTVDSTLSMIGAQQKECTLGDVTADAVRMVCGSDIAILPGELFYMNLQGGEVTEQILTQVYSADPSVLLAEISPIQLKTLLEAGYSRIVIGANDTVDGERSDFEGFPQISGFTVTCDYSAPPGERVLSVALEDGLELDLEDESPGIVLAAAEKYLSGQYGAPAVEGTVPTEETVLSCVIRQLEQGPLTLPEGTRLTVLGARQNLLIHNIPPTVLIVFLAVLLAMSGIAYGMKKSEACEEGEKTYEV